MAGGYLLVDRREQRAGAAGEVGYAQPAYGFGIGPVHALQLGDGQPGQQRRRRGQRVEGRQVLAVGDEPLEDAAGQVVGVVDAGGVYGLRGKPQPRQNPGGVTRRKLLQNVPGDGEDGPVVDFQDSRPCGQHFVLRVVDPLAAHQVERLDARVHAGEPLVEDESVGDDGAGHAAGLAYGSHAKQIGDGLSGSGAQLGGLGKPPLGPVDASFQGVGRRVHRPLRQRRQADEIGDVLDGPFQPAGLREAREAVPLLGEEAIGQAGVAKLGIQITGVVKLIGIAKRDGGFYGATAYRCLPPEAGRCLGFDIAGGFVLGFDHDGGSSGGGNEDVRLQAAPLGDGAGVLGPHLASGQHPLKQATQGVVNARFGLSRRVCQWSAWLPCGSVQSGHIVSSTTIRDYGSLPALSRLRPDVGTR